MTSAENGLLVLSVVRLSSVIKKMKIFITSDSESITTSKREDNDKLRCTLYISLRDLVDHKVALFSTLVTRVNLGMAMYGSIYTHSTVQERTGRPTPRDSSSIFSAARKKRTILLSSCGMDI